MQLDQLILGTAPSPKYSKMIGCIFGQMQLTKFLICRKIENLSQNQFDFEPDFPVSPISTLFKHMIYTEKFYQAIIFDNKLMTGDENAVWKGCLPNEFIPKLNRGRSFKYYQNLWDNVRSITERQLQLYDDDWLYQHRAGGLKGYGTNYFCLFHIMEDHLCHFGQIRTLIASFKKDGRN